MGSDRARAGMRHAPVIGEGRRGRRCSECLENPLGRPWRTSIHTVADGRRGDASDEARPLPLQAHLADGQTGPPFVDDRSEHGA